MGLLDREWFVEDHARREKEYGGDFSLQSKKVSDRNKNKVQNLSPIEEELQRIRKQKAEKNKTAIVVGALSLLFAVLCFVGVVPSDGILPPAIGLINGYLCIKAGERKKKENDKTNLNSCAILFTSLSLLAMLWLVI